MDGADEEEAMVGERDEAGAVASEGEDKAGAVADEGEDEAGAVVREGDGPGSEHGDAGLGPSGRGACWASGHGARAAGARRPTGASGCRVGAARARRLAGARGRGARRPSGAPWRRP